MYVAKGLPNPKVNTPLPELKFQEGVLGIQEHLADKAGPHLDLRIALPQTGIAHSWAIPQARMPMPGEKLLAVESGDHDINYMGFSGVLTKGYGKGRVHLQALDKIEVLESDSNKITFAQYTGSGVNRYTLVRILGKDWLLLNTTATNKTRSEIPQFKRSYSEIDEASVRAQFHNPNVLMAPKIDGAHVIIGLRPERRIDVFSYRPSKKGQELIDHSFKTELYKHKSPTSVGKTILRAELFGIDPITKRPLQSAMTGGLLNSGTLRSREMQKTQGKLTHLIYDIDVYKGHDVSNLPYSQKLELLERVKQQVPELQIVQPARSYIEKSNLLDEIQSGKHPLTQEGVVVYDLHKSTPEKYKITKDIDVYFHSPFSPLKGSHLEHMGAVGGFYASREPGGEPNIRVGSGLSNELRQEIARNPEAFKNRVAKIYVQEEFKSGKLRMPILKEFRDYEQWNTKTALSEELLWRALRNTGIKLQDYSTQALRHHNNLLDHTSQAMNILRAHGVDTVEKMRTVKVPQSSIDNIEKNILPHVEAEAGLKDFWQKMTKRKYDQEWKFRDRLFEKHYDHNVDNFDAAAKIKLKKTAARTRKATGKFTVPKLEPQALTDDMAHTVGVPGSATQDVGTSSTLPDLNVVKSAGNFNINWLDDLMRLLTLRQTPQTTDTNQAPGDTQIQGFLKQMPQTPKVRLAENLLAKSSSVLDPVQDTLCPELFDVSTNLLLPETRISILKGLQTILGPDTKKVSHVMLLGGSVSYQWTRDTDIDINVIFPKEYLPDSETFALYQTKMKSFRTHMFRGHPVSYTLKAESGTEFDNTENLLALYDVLGNSWVKAPDPKGVDLSWMIELNKPYLTLFRDFLRAGASNLVKAVKRHEDPKSLVDKAVDVSEAYKQIDRARKLSYEESFGIPNLSQANVFYKYLTDDPVIHKLEDVYHAIKPKLLKGWYS